MTGYGRGECLLHDRKAVVEIKSVNHRYNDLTVKLPRMINRFEDRLRKLFSASIQRGKTDVYVSVESFATADAKVNVNEALAGAYIEAVSGLQVKFGIAGDVSLGMVAAFHDVVTVERQAADETVLSEIWETVEQSARQALTQFLAMREAEGESLKTDILSKLTAIEDAAAQVATQAPLIAKAYEERLRTRMAELLDNMPVDENRLLTEVAILAERTCVDEELTRLASHTAQMRGILNQSDAVGRKLDFLVQEMNREINTIGSKSSNVAITETVVELKSTLEKIREQVQNIE